MLQHRSGPPPPQPPSSGMIRPDDAAAVPGLDSCNFEFETFQDFKRESVGWLYPKNSILKTYFDQEFLQSEEKAINIRNKQQQPKIKDCNSPPLIQVDISFTTIFFGIWCIGSVTSVLVFAIEVAWFSLH